MTIWDEMLDEELRRRMPQQEPGDWYGGKSVAEMAATYLREQGPLESWRMPEWDNRDGYYDDGTVLRAEDVPIYRPASGGIPPDDGLSEIPHIRFWAHVCAPHYRLDWVPIWRVFPFRRDTPVDLAWIELFVDLIRRGSEPPPIICDLVNGSIINGSVRTCALRELGRGTVHAWVAQRGEGI